MRALGRFETQVFTVGPDTTVVEVADEMDEHAIGCLVVVDDAGGPLGILTDRDLLCRVVAAGRDPARTRARDVMTPDPACVEAGDPLVQVVRLMKERGIRRLPVVRDGVVESLVSLDDVLQAISSDLWNVSEATRIEIRDARRTAWRRRMREHRDEALEELRTQAAQLGGETRDFLKRELGNLLDSIRRGGA